MIAALSQPSRIRLHLGLFLSLTASPALAVPLDIHASNIAPSDTRSAVAPALPIPRSRAKRSPDHLSPGCTAVDCRGADGRGAGGAGEGGNAASGQQRDRPGWRAACPGRHARSAAGTRRPRSCGRCAQRRCGDRRTQHAGRRGHFPTPHRRAKTRSSRPPPGCRCSASSAAARDQGPSSGPLGAARCEICVGAP